MERVSAAIAMSDDLEPLCPRDDHKMKFDAEGVRWQQAADNEAFAVATYHCGFEGCSVRYAPEHGYFTVVKAPELPVFIEEPAVNTLQCPVHNVWLYRKSKANGAGFEWGCGCDGCEYCHADVPGNWLRQ